MGVPKFFRWMSERYPAISQLIAENRIPEFDCLYLDMSLRCPINMRMSTANGLQTALYIIARTKTRIRQRFE